MAEFIKLAPDETKRIGSVDPRLISYNIEMAEVTGGTFWKSYTPEQKNLCPPKRWITPQVLPLWKI